MQKLLKHIFKRFTNLLVAFPVFLIQPVQAPVDNLTILNQLAAAVVDSVINELSPDTSTAILIRSQSPQDEGNWWIENWFVKCLYQRGITQVFLNQQGSGSGWVIEFKLLSLKVEYLSISNSKLIERKCHFKLAIRVFEAASGFIRFFHEFSKLYKDSIMIKDVKKLEDNDFSFTRAALPEQRGLNKYLEPITVMITTAGVIYLFFHLRSN